MKHQDDRTETNFIVPLRMHFWRYKCILYKLKVFLIHIGGNRRWQPLTLGKLGTRGTLAVRLAVKQLQPVVTQSVQGVQHGFCTLTSIQHTTPVHMIEDTRKTW